MVILTHFSPRVNTRNILRKIYTGEAAGIIAIYTVLIALITNPVIEGVENLVEQEKHRVVKSRRKEARPLLTIKK